MDLLGALAVLVRVVETGSFSAVARERELSQAAVARQCSLPDRLGVQSGPGGVPGLADRRGTPHLGWRIDKLAYPGEKQFQDR
jgi:hypothetical protein